MCILEEDREKGVQWPTEPRFIKLLNHPQEVHEYTRANTALLKQNRFLGIKLQTIEFGLFATHTHTHSARAMIDQINSYYAHSGIIISIGGGGQIRSPYVTLLTCLQITN